MGEQVLFGVALVAFEWLTLWLFAKAVLEQRYGSAMISGLLHYAGTFGGGALMLRRLSVSGTGVLVWVSVGYFIGLVFFLTAWAAHARRAVSQEI